MRCRWGDTRHTWGRCRHNTVVFQTNLADCTVLRDNVLDSQSSAREAAGKHRAPFWRGVVTIALVRSRCLAQFPHCHIPTFARKLTSHSILLLSTLTSPLSHLSHPISFRQRISPHPFYRFIRFIRRHHICSTFPRHRPPRVSANRPDINTSTPVARLTSPVR